MDIVKDVAAALIATLILWAIGLPGSLYRSARSAIKGLRVSRRLAAGSFDQQAIETATRHYVRPLYSNVDPANEWEPSHALINARADLFSMVDRFINTDFVEQKHMLLFADSGMGKTSFLLNYLDHNYRITNFRKQKILVLQLSQLDSDKFIESVPFKDRAHTNIFLDALDEDPRAMSNVHGRIQQLLELARSFRTVIITCRSQFFRSDEQIPVHTGLPKLGPVPLGQPKHYNFFRVYLSPFDDRQVNQYLQRRFPGLLGIGRRRRARRLIDRVPSLAVRPMLLAHMPDVLESNDKIRSAADVYQAMVDAWIRRESSWVDPNALKEFSGRLAMNLYANRKSRGGEIIDAEELAALASEVKVPISADLVTSRSLLNRTSDGHYKFAHRSIMEFFVAESLLATRPRDETPLTDQMARFILERLGCWSEEMAAIAGLCNVVVKFVSAQKRLGLSTSYELYEPIADNIAIQEFLRLRYNSTAGPSPALNVDELLHDLCQTSFGVDVSQVHDIRLLIDGTGAARSTRTVRIAAWMNSYCAITEIEVPRSMSQALSLLETEQLPVMLSATPASGTSELSRANWTMSTRISIPAFDRATAAPALREAMALSYKDETNTLLLAVADEALRPEGPLAPFGILGIPADRSPVKNRPYGLIGPIRSWATYAPQVEIIR